MNDQWIDNLTQDIETCNACADLQKLVGEAFQDIIGPLKADIEAELAKLLPAQELTDLPDANPAAIVTWLEKLVTHIINPYLAPILTLQAQLADLESKIAKLTGAVEQAASRLESCQISLPSI